MSESDDQVGERVVKVYRAVSPGGKPPRHDGSGELDSMAFIEFITLLEREFNITVDLRDLNDTNFKTTEQTVAYLRRKMGV